MEVKLREAAIAVLCLLLMLSAQQQEVDALSKYCACYNGCYTGCRQHLPPWACVALCLLDCSPTGPNNPGTGDIDSPAPSQPGDGASGATSCMTVCSSLFTICGSSGALPGSADAASCVQNCNEKLGLN